MLSGLGFHAECVILSGNNNRHCMLLSLWNSTKHERHVLSPCQARTSAIVCYCAACLYLLMFVNSSDDNNWHWIAVLASWTSTTTFLFWKRPYKYKQHQPCLLLSVCELIITNHVCYYHLLNQVLSWLLSLWDNNNKPCMLLSSAQPGIVCSSQLCCCHGLEG